MNKFAPTFLLVFFFCLPVLIHAQPNQQLQFSDSLRDSATSDPLRDGATGDPLTDTGTLNFGRRVSGSGDVVSIQNPLAANSITEFFLDLIQIVLIFAIPIIVFFIILAGFKYVTAQGNQSKVQEAHRALLYAIVGGLLILGAQIILTVIQGTVDSFTV